MRGIWNMKKLKLNKKPNKKVESLLWLSIHNSLNHIGNTICFKVVMFVIVCLVLMWQVSFTYDILSWSDSVYNNTKLLESDDTLVNVQHISENKTVFDTNGNSYKDYTYASILYGNEMLFSIKDNVLAVPVSLSECIQVMVGLSVTAIVIGVLVYIICSKYFSVVFRVNIWVGILFIFLLSLIIVGFTGSMMLQKLFSNIQSGYPLGIFVNLSYIIEVLLIYKGLGLKVQE